MAANVINQISAANTFQQWLVATTSLIGTTNLLINGNGESFFANTNLVVGGSGSNVSLNVETSATINDLVGNTANVIDVQIRDLDVTGNVATLNVTNDSAFGGDVRIDGDLIVSGNITLDEIGFDDLTVSGSASIANNLTVAGTANTTGNATFRNAEVTGTLTANVFVGNANTGIYSAIQSAADQSIAFSIALG